MNPRTIHRNQHQMSRHDRTWGTSKVGGCDGRVEAPAADYAQGGRHVPSVGNANSVLSKSGISHCLTCLPVNWRGLRAPSFSLRTAGGRCIGRQRRRLVASPPGRPAAALQFSAALLIGRSHQLYRIGNQLGRYSADPLHLRSPFVESRSNTGTMTRTKGRNLGNVSRQGPRRDRSPN